MTDYRLSPEAYTDVEWICRSIATESGADRARSVRAEVLRVARNLARYPRMGHPREDLTKRSVLFWSVYSYLIVYRLDTEPLGVIRVLHGARDPDDIRDQVGDRVALVADYSAADLPTASTRSSRFAIAGSR